MGVLPTYAQHLGSSRFIGLGGAAAFADDLSAIDWNPAGLSLVQYWSLSGTSFMNSTGGQTSGTFSLAGAASRLSENHSVAARFSPGVSLEFIVPSTFTVADSTTQLVARFDKAIEYRERFAAGYAYRFNDRLAAGIAIHDYDENVKDVQYVLDSNSVLVSTIVESHGGSIGGDLGVLWEPLSPWVIGAVVKNAFTLAHSELPEEVRDYALSRRAYGRLGIGYRGLERTLLGLDLDTERRFRLGGEWTASEALRLQGSVYTDASDGFIADAASVGLTYRFNEFTIGANYLGFLHAETHAGSADLEAFLSSPLQEIEYNRYVPSRASFSVSMNIGTNVVALAKIEYADIAGDVYPAARTTYALNPIGKARVRNLSDKPIDARVRFRVDGFMNTPTEMQPRRIEPGAVEEIPVYALFSDNLNGNRDLSVREGVIEVRSTAGGDAEDRYPAKILVHGRNDWNGDAGTLKYFVRPDDDSVIAFTRRVLGAQKAMLDTLPSQLQAMAKVRLLFDSLAARLTYVADPEKADDFVQYPGETLRLRSGDCDDMSVCYSSLLNGVGIPTAFIDVVPPSRPDSSHIYMMLDTGIDAAQAHTVSNNAKRYLIRTNSQGNPTVWLPLETTVVRSGFDAAWSTGAEEYYTDVELKLGLVKGWVRLVDLAIIN
jgi:hypothetical protein